MKASFMRGADTLLYSLGLVLLLAAPLYFGAALLHKIGVPSPAQLAGASGAQS